jgi:hypothetical protein
MCEMCSVSKKMPSLKSFKSSTAGWRKEAPAESSLVEAAAGAERNTGHRWLLRVFVVVTVVVKPHRG